MWGKAPTTYSLKGANCIFLTTCIIQLQSFAMARYPLTGSRVSLSVSTRVRGMHCKRGNYCGLELTEQIMKIMERILDGLIRQLVSVDNSQFGFVPGRGTTDAIFVVRQLQEKYLAGNKRLHGFHRPGEGVWSSAFKGHLVGAEKTWCGGVDCATGAGDVWQCAESYPCWWGVQWRVWSEGRCSPSSVLSPLLFIIVLETLSREFRSGFPWEDLLCWWPCYHRSISQGMCQEALDLERSIGGERTESKMLESWRSLSAVGAWTSCRIQASFNAPSVALEWASTASSAKAASTGCTRNAVGSSASQRTLITDVVGASELLAPWTAGHRGKSQVQTWQAEDCSFFCYLGDMLSTAGGCELSTTTRVKTAWKKFKEQLPGLSSPQPLF